MPENDFHYYLKENLAANLNVVEWLAKYNPLVNAEIQLPNPVDQARADILIQPYSYANAIIGIELEVENSLDNIQENIYKYWRWANLLPKRWGYSSNVAVAGVIQIFFYEKEYDEITIEKIVKYGNRLEIENKNFFYRALYMEYEDFRAFKNRAENLAYRDETFRKNLQYLINLVLKN